MGAGLSLPSAQGCWNPPGAGHPFRDEHPCGTMHPLRTICPPPHVPGAPCPSHFPGSEVGVGQDQARHVPVGTHSGVPWGPMGSHVVLWGTMGSHRSPVPPVPPLPRATARCGAACPDPAPAAIPSRLTFPRDFSIFSNFYLFPHLFFSLCFILFFSPRFIFNIFSPPLNKHNHCFFFPLEEKKPSSFVLPFVI